MSHFPLSTTTATFIDISMSSHYRLQYWLCQGKGKLCISTFRCFKSCEVPNKFALKFYIMYLFCFACLVLNIQRGNVTENVSQMILKFLTFSVVGCHFIFQTHKKVFSQMFYDQIIVLRNVIKRELYFTQTGKWINKT